MLTESFVAAVAGSEKPTAPSAVFKDAGIFLYNFQPTPLLKATFKKSSANTNCLAISPTHVFTAQTDKSVIHVYSRERGNQEAIVPFPERISCLTLITSGNAGVDVLACGTEKGRLILWELSTGRQVSTHPSHLQPISCITVDSASNFLLTGSPDSNIHVWSILSLLSFSHATSYSSDESLSGIVQTLSNHSGAITALVASRSHPSSSFAVSASEDNTCIVWDYRVGSVLHTFILTSTPLCLELDPACRAFYAGFDDGSVRLVDLYKRGNLINGALDSTSSSTASQPPSSSHWKVDGAESPALSLTLGYDGTILLSGHQDGKVHEWDVGRGKCESHSLELFAPVTNIHMLPPQGFLHGRSEASKSLTVVKPRYEHSLGSLSMASTDSVPDNYSSSTQFTAALTLPRIKASGSQLLDLMSEFNALLEDPSFPPSLLDEGLSALSANPQPAATIVPPSATDESFESEIRELKSQLLFIKSSRASLLSSSLNIADELERMKNAETARRRAKKVARIKRNQIEERRRRLAMGEHLSDREEAMDDDHASSDTDELAGSD